jgi:hypothetical protein
VKASIFLLPFALGLLAACATEETQQSPAPAPPDTNVYYSPLPGKDIPARQQDRDRYECAMWAGQQTNFDPSDPLVPPPQRVFAVRGAPPPGAAASNQPSQNADTGRAGSSQASEGANDARAAVLGPQATQYRRALSACLEGRGYSVK